MYVLTYFQHHYKNEHFQMMLPMASVAIRMFNSRRRLPYKILALVDPSADYVEGHFMMWPLEFCLPLSTTKFAYEFKLPVYQKFERKLSLEDEDYIKLMQALHVFCLAILRKWNVTCSERAFYFNMAQENVQRNLCLYFGLVLDDPTF